MPIDNIVVAYSASFPPNDNMWQKYEPNSPDIRKQIEDNFQNTQWAKIEPDENLIKLLEAIQELKGQTAEIYKLKALAFEIKAKLAETPVLEMRNGPKVEIK